MTPKKASEIIPELQEQVEYLTRLVQSQDHLLKLILKKLNSFETIKPSQPFQPSHPVRENVVRTEAPQRSASPRVMIGERETAGLVERLSGQEALAMKVMHAQQENKKSQFEQMRAQMGLDDDSEPDLLDGVARKQDGTLQQATSFKGQRRGQRVDRTATDTSIMVTQQLIFEGKPLPLATVKITDSIGQVVKSARSGVKGKWTLPLLPGNYNIHILKNYVTDHEKKPVELTYSIRVPVSEDGKIELPPHNVEG